MEANIADLREELRVTRASLRDGDRERDLIKEESRRALEEAEERLQKLAAAMVEKDGEAARQYRDASQEKRFEPILQPKRGGGGGGGGAAQEEERMGQHHRQKDYESLGRLRGACDAAEERLKTSSRENARPAGPRSMFRDPSEEEPRVRPNKVGSTEQGAGLSKACALLGLLVVADDTST